jgi:hypothetical protein
MLRFVQYRLFMHIRVFAVPAILFNVYISTASTLYGVSPAIARLRARTYASVVVLVAFGGDKVGLWNTVFRAAAAVCWIDLGRVHHIARSTALQELGQ